MYRNNLTQTHVAKQRCDNKPVSWSVGELLRSRPFHGPIRRTAFQALD